MGTSVVQQAAGAKLEVAALGTTVGSFATESVAIGEVRNISFSMDVEVIDVTHLGSPSQWREFIPGNADPGNLNIDLNYLPDNLAGVDASPGPAVDGHHEIEIVDRMGSSYTFRITWADGEYIQFDGSWESLTGTAEITSQLTATQYSSL